MILPFVVSFTLLALIAGMFLLAHTKKDNLGGFFKFISWFVIVSSIVMMVYAISANSCRLMMRCKMGCDKEMMMGKCGMHGPEGMMGCCGHDGMMGGCDKEKMGCCDKEKGMMGCDKDKEKMGCKDMDKMTPEQKADAKVKMLTEKIKLTPEQAPKVKDIFLKCYQSCDMNMKDAKGDKDKCNKMCEKNCKDKVEALKKVLTPEQFKNLPECCTKMCCGK